jgi:hypothetical protein
MPVREMNVLDNIGRIQQNDKIVGQETNGVDPQVRLAQKNRTGLSDSHRAAHDCNVDVSGIAGMICPISMPLAP